VGGADNQTFIIFQGKINQYQTLLVAKYDPVTNYSFEVSTTWKLSGTVRMVPAHNTREINDMTITL